MSRFKKGKAFHLVKKSPACDEPLREQIPGGFAVIVDRVLTNSEGTWLEINKQTLYQFKVTLAPPMYLCAILRGQSVLFDKIYGDYCIVCWTQKCGKENGGEGHRSPYLSHAKRALYHLSYTPSQPLSLPSLLDSQYSRCRFVHKRF